MGNDEHGPAYPERYRCPICRGNEFRYLECEYPGCLDGRDRGHPHARVWSDEAWKQNMRETYPIRDELAKRSPSWATMISGWATAVALVVWLLWPHGAPAMDHGFDPNSPTTQWMERQIRPDSPPNSCCGEADAYPVDHYQKLPGGDFEVWIQDGDAITFPDGSIRHPWDISVPLTVPFNKINPESDDLDNPTDHGWLFFRPTNDREPGTFFCFIRHPQGS